VPTIDPTLERFIGSGSVYIAWHQEDRVYEGYWDSSPDGLPGEPLQQLSPTRSQREAVEWGRHRAPRVLIRPEADPGVYYWAGMGEPIGTDADLQRLPL
jgi:hypothetical protein